MNKVMFFEKYKDDVISFRNITHWRLIDKSRHKIYKANYNNTKVIVKKFKTYKSFQNEYMNLKILQGHENIIKCFGYTCNVRNYYILMEYCKRGDLTYFLCDEFRSKFRIWCRQILEGIKWMHSKKIIHLDLKPDNIGITEDFQVKILDFEFAVNKLNISSDHETEGTLWYMDVNLLSGKSPSESNDIYSFGMILYVFYNQSCKIPYEEYTDSYVLFKLLVNNKISLNLDIVCESVRIWIKKCITQDENERCTVDELLNAINTFE